MRRLVLRIVLNNVHGLLLEGARSGLVEALQPAGRSKDEWVESDLDVRAEVIVHSFQCGGAKLLASRSFVAEPKSQLGCGSSLTSSKEKH